jgi:hypothetical protein
MSMRDLSPHSLRQRRGNTDLCETLRRGVLPRGRVVRGSNCRSGLFDIVKNVAARRVAQIENSPLLRAASIL